MKKLLVTMMVVILVVALAACSNSKPANTAATETPSTGSTSDTSDTGGRETKVIGFSYLHLDTAMTGWWELDQKLMDEYNADDSNPYYLEYYFTNAEADTAKELANVESLIVRKPDVIMIKPVDSDGSVPAFQAVQAAGIPVVNDGFTINYDGPDCTLIAMDNYYAGRLAGEWYSKYLEDNPDFVMNLCYLNADPSNQDMAARHDGFMDVMNENWGDTGRFIVLSENIANYDANKGMAIAEDWLITFPQMNAIATSYDEIAIAAAQACSAAGREVLICGMDGLEGALLCIQEGTMACSIVFDWDQMAVGSFEIIKSIISGEAYDKVFDVSAISTSLCDASNVTEYLKRYQ